VTVSPARQTPILVAILLAAAGASGAAEPVRIAAMGEADLAGWEARVAAGLRAGTLKVLATEDDTLVPGRRHLRYAQLHRAVPVFGGQVALQYAGERLISAFGFLHDGIELDVRPALSLERAVALAEGLTGGRLDPETAPELTVLPKDDGYALAYRLRLIAPADLIVLFLDATSGGVALQYSDLQTQSAAGVGTGVLNDRKKISVRTEPGGGFSAEDLLRPMSIRTLDMKGQFLFRPVRLDDVAFDADNDWQDAAVVDAHAHVGWTYDYLHRRFGRRGLDGQDGIGLLVIAHPVRREDFGGYPPAVVGLYYTNAFYSGGRVVFGEGLPPGVVDSRGRSWDYTSGALDIVAHEVAHGVTAYSSRLVYLNESGALNESFSDIIGLGAEFVFHEPGSGPRQADYLMGEDVVRPRGVRSFADPCSSGSGCYPDHYSLRYQGTLDNGGVHVNSSISNHAFYLAVEGGTNRTSGVRVQGVGPSRRADVERVFYRAFTSMLTPTADFSMARATTLQSARDLHGSGSDVERAVAAAWTAVGVP
jgi:thermolysin